MHDALAAIASAFLADAALPLLLWTVLALAAEAALRAGRAHAALSLPIRSALLAALPAVLVAGPLLRWATPAAIVASAPLARVREAVLPEAVVGAPAALPVGPSVALVWLGAALCLAALIGAVALVRLAVAHVRLARLGWPAAPDAVQQAAAEALAGARRPVRVVSGGAVPFTFGAWRPVVAVPPGLSGEALRLALAHEAAHVRAHDYAWQVAARAVAGVFAAHPLVHVLVRGLALDRERLADAAVLAGRPEARRAYAELLVSLSAVPAPRLALGVARPPLLHRLTAMTLPTSAARVRAARLSGRLVAAAMFAAVLIGGWASAAQPAASRDFEMIDPVIMIDGVIVESGGTRMTAQNFRFLEITADGYGRFLVSDAPFSGAEQVGAFEGPRLSARVAGHTLGILAETDLLGEGETPAYVRFDAYDGTPAPLETSSLTVGVAQTINDLEPVVNREEGARGMVTAFRQRRRVVQESRVAGSPARPADSFRLTAAGDTVFDFVGEMPELIGGVAALQAALVYPEEARRDNVEGTAILRFVVTAEGAADQIEVVRSIDPRLDAAAVEAVRGARFTPGRQDGRAVAVRMTLPIRFVLPADRGALPTRGVVRYAGVDLSRLANGPQIQAMIDALPASLAAAGVPYGSARTDYTLTRDGQALDLRSTGDGALRDATSVIVRAFVSPEGNRPGTTWDGFFTLWYAPD